MSQLSKGEKLLVGGGVALVVGLLLPWVTIEVLGFSESASGLSAGGVGYLLLLMGLGMAGLGYHARAKGAKGMLTGALVCAVLSLLIIVLNYPSSGELGDSIKLGIGYWVSLLGSAVGLVGAVMMKKEMKG